MLGSSKAGLVGLLATIIWFKRKSTPDDIINVTLYPTYDYIIGKYVEILAFETNA